MHQHVAGEPVEVADVFSNCMILLEFVVVLGVPAPSHRHWQQHLQDYFITLAMK